MATIIDRSLGNRSNITDSPTIPLNGVEQLEIVKVGSSTFVYVTSFFEDGISIFELSNTGELTFLSTIGDTASTALNGPSPIHSVSIGGQTYLYVAGNADDGISSFRVNGDGSLTHVQSVFDDATLELNGPVGRMSTVVVQGTTYLIASGDQDSGISVFRLGADGSMTNVDNVTDAENPNYRLTFAFDTATATIGTNSYVFVACRGEFGGITSFRVEAGGTLTFADSVVDNATLELGGARHLAVGVLNTTTFLFAAGTTDNGISVFTVNGLGILTNVFNLPDSTVLGLNSPRQITAFRVDGDLYIAVSAYSADAISYFQVAANGSLTELDAVTDAGLLELNGALANDFVEINGRGFIVVGGAVDDGISSFEIGGGNSLLVGTTDQDTIHGLGGNDDLRGQGSNDVLFGGAGNDRLDGGAGNDMMEGGLGNDTYVIGSVGDGVIELPGEGTDTVVTYIQNYTLGLNLERLVMGSAVVKAVGNDVANTIGGSAIANEIFGGGGNDYITAGSGNDFIDGGTGVDFMLGGVGNDTFVVNATTDRAVEYSGEGTDTVNSFISGYKLAANVERLVLASTVYEGFGNELNNTIVGASNNNALRGLEGRDYLTGAGGNDLLVGGTGGDTLVGGAGSDHFDYNAVNESPRGPSLRDTIAGFTHGADRIDFSTIDANTLVVSNQAFSFIGKAAFSGIAGQVRYSAFGNTCLVDGDINGDSVADFQIAVNGTNWMTGTDFVL